jgi:ABC-type nitrate/sulfonate/bicarbonate transport system substrate-binding protein
VQCRFRRQGFFKKNGIEAELIFVRGALTLVAALTSGDMNIGYTGGIAVLGDRHRQPASSVAGWFAQYPAVDEGS